MPFAWAAGKFETILLLLDLFFLFSFMFEISYILSCMERTSAKGSLYRLYDELMSEILNTALYYRQGLTLSLFIPPPLISTCIRFTISLAWVKILCSPAVRHGLFTQQHIYIGLCKIINELEILLDIRSLGLRRVPHLHVFFFYGIPRDEIVSSIPTSSGGSRGGGGG